MQKVKVFYFEMYDIVSDEMKRSKRPATREKIATLVPNAQVLEETAKEVDASSLDGNGFLLIGKH